MRNIKTLKTVVVFVIAVMLVSCGTSSDKISMVTMRYQEILGLYDSVAPIVAKLDDAAVENYEKAGKSVRKAKRAIDSKFEEYSNDELDELIVDLDNAKLVLHSFEGREPIKPVLKEENGTVFNVNFINQAGKQFSSILLKSGSGGNDITIEYPNGFAVDGKAQESLQVPESESFSVIGIDENGEQTVFAGSFYISTVSHITLTNDEGKYIITTELIQE